MPVSPLIAIVDDDPLVGSSIDSLVRSVGLSAILFSDGPALLASPRLQEVSCIITDLNMPRMNGLELQAALLDRGGAQHIIFMTAFPTAEARNQAISAGALAFLVKPVDPDMLLSAIDMAID